MQILQWLFKRAYQQERDCNTSSPSTKREAINDKNAKGEDIAPHRDHRAYQRTRREGKRKLGCNNLKVFAFICGKDIPKACFYRTINLRRLRSLNRRREFVHSVKMKREELYRGVGINEKADSNGHVRKKVLPITEVSLTTSTERNDQCSNKEAKDQNKGNRKKTISRMKELLRWAATGKTEKREKFNGQKVLHFRKHGTIKGVPVPVPDEEDHQLSTESPKISFTWDVESFSTISSVYSSSSSSSSAISTASLFKNEHLSPVWIPPQPNGHITCRKGNWITTDSEFVVLEL